MNCSQTNQAFNQYNMEMCNSEGTTQTAAAQRSLHTEATGEPLQLNRSLLCTDKQQFPESPSPPLSEFTWGLGASAHAGDRGQSKCVSTNTRNTRWTKTSPKTALDSETFKLLGCRITPECTHILYWYLWMRAWSMHMVRSCTHAHACQCSYFHAVVDTLYANEI